PPLPPTRVVRLHRRGDPRALHSFPTRRSSDLPGRVTSPATEGYARTSSTRRTTRSPSTISGISRAASIASVSDASDATGSASQLSYSPSIHLAANHSPPSRYTLI